MPGMSSPLIAGVDGCRGGWVVATGGVGPLDAGRRVEVHVAATLAPLLGRVDDGEVSFVAVDMPIGLPERGPRRCDAEARALLGARRSSVFPAPVRASLGAKDHAEACRRSLAASGRALSVQAYNLLPKIAELDRLLDPGRHDTVVESHPELAFLRLAGGAPLPPKRSAEGRRRRTVLVGPVLGGADPVVLAGRAGAPVLDVLDAAALLATARHLAAGTAHVLGGGERDRTGRPMRIAW